MARAPLIDAIPVDRKDSVRAGAVLGRAFSDSAQWAPVLADEDARPRKLEQMFAGTVKMTFAARGVAERTSGFEAVALWLPPGRDIGAWTMVKSGFAQTRFAMTPPFPKMRQMTAMLREFDGVHKRQMPDPHWYLMALGVDPAHHRKGHGSALVRRGMERADADNKPIYLETEAGGNVDFYRRLGFKVLDEVVIEAIDLPFALLVRHPSPANR